MSFECEPSLELLHISAKKVFLEHCYTYRLFAADKRRGNNLNGFKYFDVKNMAQAKAIIWP